MIYFYLCTNNPAGRLARSEWLGDGRNWRPSAQFYGSPGTSGADLERSIVINEIHYHPDIETERVEFIELFNAGDGAVDLSNWYFSEGIDHTFAEGERLEAGAYYVLSQDMEAYNRKFGSIFAGGVKANAQFAALANGDEIGWVENDGDPADWDLHTIDTGTGRWEEHYPGEGVLPVIRTGGHFLLTKTSAYRRFGPPWHRTRLAARPIDALAEVDNFARQHLSGENPFRALPAWDTLTQRAKEASGAGPSSVGEDSGFCDALLAAGGKIYVDTDLWVGHVAKHVITPDMLKRELDLRRSRTRAACGVLA